MKKIVFLLGFLTLLLVYLVLFFKSVPAKGQFPASQGYGREIELLPPLSHYTNGANQSTGLLAPRLRGVPVKFRNNLACCVQVSSAPTGFPSSLSMYFQSSADNGQTWQDFANVFVPATIGTSCAYLTLGDPNNTHLPTSVPANTDGTMTQATVNQWPIGERIRVKYQASWGNNGGTWAFHAFVIPD